MKLGEIIIDTKFRMVYDKNENLYDCNSLWKLISIAVLINKIDNRTIHVKQDNNVIVYNSYVSFKSNQMMRKCSLLYPNGIYINNAYFKTSPCSENLTYSRLK